MAGISATGLGSGLDIASLVDQLVAAERQAPANRLNLREARANTELSAIGKLKSAIASFRDALEPLQTLEKFQGRKVSVADEKIFTASAGTASAPGGYAIEVLTVAAAQKLASQAFADADTAIGTGILTIAVGADSVAIDLTAAAASLADIRDAINGAPNNPGVTATIVTADDGARLVVTASEPGTANAVAIGVTGGDGGLAPFAYAAGAPANPMSVLQPATDATLNIDGFLVTRPSNRIADAIDGVTIDLKKASPGDVLQLKVDVDTAVAKKSVQDFVAAYNKLLDTIAEVTKYDKDKREAAPLVGNATVRNLRETLRRELSAAVASASPQLSSLATVGVTTQSNGKLEINATKLDNAIAESLDSVAKLFVGDAGLATRLDAVLGDTIESTSALTLREDTLKSVQRLITGQRAKLDQRMDALRERLRDQYNSLDSLLSQLKNTSAFLTQQLKS